MSSRSILGCVFSTALIATYATATMCSNALTSYEQLDSLPTFPEGQQDSYLARNLNQSIWDELSDKTDSYGFSFKQAIFSGCKNPESGVGVYAGSPDSYNAFSSLFTPIIDQYHKRDQGAKHESNIRFQDVLDDLLPQAGNLAGKI